MAGFKSTIGAVCGHFGKVEFGKISTISGNNSFSDNFQADADYPL
jgi:hypothetical protein